MNDWAEQFAKELKKRENPQILGAILGTVIVPPPKLEISILNNSVIIKKCYILKNICQGYTRIIEIPEQTATGKAKGKGYTIGGTDTHDVVTDVTIQSVGMPSAEICFIDTLKAGDEVLLVVSPDNQTYFVIGKVPMGSITKMLITIQGITSCTNHTATEGGLSTRK